MKFKEKFGRALSVGILKAKEASPTVMIVAGVVGFVGAAILASKATLKVEPIVDEAKKDLDNVKKIQKTKEIIARGENESIEVTQEMVSEDIAAAYSEKDARTDIAKTYGRAAWKLTKLYLPAVTVFCVSSALVFGSHNIMLKRNASLAATATAVQTAFDNYRKTVAKRFGEEIEQEIRDGIVESKENMVEYDSEGNETVIKSSPDPLRNSPYAFYFNNDIDNPYRSDQYVNDDNFANELFLKNQENYLNTLLISRRSHFVSMNDLAEALGIKWRTEWQRIGWFYDPYKEVSDTPRDNRIKFRLHKVLVEKDDRRYFEWVIDPNVEGDASELLNKALNKNV